jgi:hypothetical protein
VTSVAPHAALRARWKTFVVAFLVFAAVGTSWLVATPLMGVPDEPPHAVRAAAVVRGEITPNGT